MRGGKHPLSNLHNCPEGCVIKDGQYDFNSSEQHYQFGRLYFHGKVDESYHVLEVDMGFQAMKIAEVALLNEEKSDWLTQAVVDMRNSNVLKYESCPHAHEYLLSTDAPIVEATSNVFWGSGLPPDLTRSTLCDFWPGQNNLGSILMDLRESLLETGKCKASSPLVHVSKSAHQ